MKWKVTNANCVSLARQLDKRSVDAIVTDPPYEIGFMGKGWDKASVSFSVKTWKRLLRVAKPGTHLLAFGGTRTFHRIACAIEDAGWEIRDTIMWVYGSGFPKSLDVGKAIDKAAGVERERTGNTTARHAQKAQNKQTMNHFASADHNPDTGLMYETAPATDAAKQWDGWGTALKPAWEPIIVARKPLEGTVAANVQKHGTGGINIDGCRVGTIKKDDYGRSAKNGKGTVNAHNGFEGKSFKIAERGGEYASFKGRWPANVIHDGSEEVLAAFPTTTSGKPSGTRNATKTGGGFSKGWGDIPLTGFGDSGSVSRFFYCAKTSKSERGEGNNHPTVKPLALMRWLVRLVTPPGGLVLDPFCGSGSTGTACAREGFSFHGVDKSDEYCEIARKRIRTVRSEMKNRKFKIQATRK